MKHPDELTPYLDEQGRVKEWPVDKREAQRQVRDYLASKIEAGKAFSEAEINDTLNAWHTFGDTALLRRELISVGWLKRKPDGATYWRIAFNKM
jgi:hypothetical protein